VLGRLGDEREVGVERLGDVVDERAEKGFADDSRRAGGDGAQQVASPGGGGGVAGGPDVALPGGGSGVGSGGFEEGGQGSRGRPEDSGGLRW
jgi:hypothetical protein